MQFSQIYEAIHHAVFSNFLSVSAITVSQLISTNTVPKPSIESTLTVTEQVSQPHIGKYQNKHTHTVYISTIRFPESRKNRKNIYKFHWALLQISSQFPDSVNIYSLIPSQNTSSTPIQNFIVLTMLWYPRSSTILNRNRNISRQCTTSL